MRDDRWLQMWQYLCGIICKLAKFLSRRRKPYSPQESASASFYPLTLLISRHIAFASMIRRSIYPSQSRRLVLLANHTRSLTVAPDYDVKLRADVKKLGMTLGNIMKAKDKDLFESVEKLRTLGREWRSPSGAAIYDTHQHTTPCVYTCIRYDVTLSARRASFVRGSFVRRSTPSTQPVAVLAPHRLLNR